MSADKPEATARAIEERIEQLEGAKRNLRGALAGLFVVIAVAFSLFHLYTAGFGTLAAMFQRGIHLTFGLVLIFLYYPAGRGAPRDRVPWYDWLLVIMSAQVLAYLLYFDEALARRAGSEITLDLVVAGAGIILVLEATRRAVGWPLCIIALAFIAYAFLGPYMPGPLGHRGYGLSRIIPQLFLTTEGIFGVPLWVSSTFIFLFILFGAFLERTGAGAFFIDLALGLFGAMRGGPAKAAILASGMLGSISGSSVANVVTTGTFTIPLMKRVGFKPHVAGGVEVAGSTNGQLMPPVMGAAAFIMAEFTGIAYLQIAAAALVPSVLSYAAMLMIIHIEAVKTGIEGLPRAELPRIGSLLAARGHLLVPVALIVVLLIMGYTPMKAAFWAIVTTVGVAMLRAESRLSWRDLLAALEGGARKALPVIAAVAAAGILVGIVQLTGLGLRLSSLIVNVAAGHLMLTLVFTMVASIILGLGLPTTATYIVLATITAPVLERFGVAVLAAHMFVFYFGILADDTPPMSLGGYAAAGIAGSNPVATGLQGFKFDLPAVILPFMFVTAPVMLLVDFTWGEGLIVLATSLLGMLALAAAIQGYLLRATLWYERAVLLGAAILLIYHTTLTDTLGIGLVLAVALLQRLRRASDSRSSSRTPQMRG